MAVCLRFIFLLSTAYGQGFNVEDEVEFQREPEQIEGDVEANDLCVRH